MTHLLLTGCVACQLHCPSPMIILKQLLPKGLVWKESPWADHNVHDFPENIRKTLLHNKNDILPTIKTCIILKENKTITICFLCGKAYVS